MATINQVLDADTQPNCFEFDHQVENVAFDADSAQVEHQVEEQETALTRGRRWSPSGACRPGKTSLLDASAPM